MSGSETGGVIMSREQFTLDLQKIPVTPQPVAQNVLLGYNADGTAVYSGSSGGGGGSALTVYSGSTGVRHNLTVNVGGTLKKKRGRPRKYGPNGAPTLAVAPTLPPATIPQSTGTFSATAPQSTGPVSSIIPQSTGPFCSPPAPQPVPLGGEGDLHLSFKKCRGRPPGLNKKQQMDSLGTSGVGFTPHIINVNVGEVFLFNFWPSY